ncbi:MAG: hypothetical protein OEY37_12905, partial [Gammaproteobacteria bacterium]|nr:hypothetical protein [Gammaproteobacteria bacterium]
MMLQRLATCCVLLLGLASIAGQADETITRGSNLSVDITADGRLAMDLAGDIWAVPHTGGDATRVTNAPGAAQRPRWSPDGLRLAYTALSDHRQGTWVYDTRDEQSRLVSQAPHVDLYPTWHPSGQRLTFSSDQGGDGFDLWEVDLPTGLRWRLSNRPGDELEPAWSADGRDLVYVHKADDQWSLVLRRLGEPEEILLTSQARLAGPSWRPDASLITVWRESDVGTSLVMVILSRPRLVRRYMDGEDYVTSPVSWLDKHRMFYSANGVIRQRLFNSWSSRTVPFRATIETAPDRVVERHRRTLPRVGEPPGRLVIHAGRVFDGIGGSYLRDQDILIEGGRISAVQP